VSENTWTEVAKNLFLGKSIIMGGRKYDFLRTGGRRILGMAVRSVPSEGKNSDRGEGSIAKKKLNRRILAASISSC